jgi:RNA 2',3'-cyclic 3'-phosphodiesterase
MRAFIAIDLPENIRAALRRKQAVFRSGCPQASWTRPEGIHLTLKFLDEISEAKVKEVSACLRTLGPLEKFVVAVKGFGFFPDAGRPRVFWVGVEAPPALPRRAERVDEAMQSLGFGRESRAFRPHLTLARFREQRAQPALQALLSQQAGDELGSFEASEFFLFESKLSPQGAEYRKVDRFR